LLWEFLPLWFTRRHAIDVGFGHPQIDAAIAASPCWLRASNADDRLAVAEANGTPQQ
jgi:hypothetical protein